MSSREIEFSYSLDRVAVPVFGIPIPMRSNPILVMQVAVNANVGGRLYYTDRGDLCTRRLSARPSVSVRVERATRRFIEMLSRELETEICYDVTVSTGGQRLPDVSIYVAVTTLIASELVGGDMEPEDLSKSLIVIERSAGVYSDYIEGARFAFTKKHNIAFRRGEGFVELSDRVYIGGIDVVAHRRLSRVPEDMLSGEIGDLVTKLVGYYVLETIQLVREDPPDATQKIFDRLENMKRLWDLLYRINSRRYYYIYDEWGRVALAVLRPAA